MIWISVISLIVAVASFGFAAYSFRQSHKVAERQLEIEESRRTEEQSASLIAYFHSDGNRRVLRIENKGNGKARNIEVLLDEQPIEQHPSWVDRQPNRITTLSGHGFGHYRLALTRSSPFPEVAEIHWEDDVKKNNVSRNSLTI